MVRPLAYITANWSDNEFEVKSTALRYCRKVYDAGFSPICPRLMYEGLLRDEIPRSTRTGSKWHRSSSEDPAFS